MKSILISLVFLFAIWSLLLNTPLNCTGIVLTKREIKPYQGTINDRIHIISYGLKEIKVLSLQGLRWVTVDDDEYVDIKPLNTYNVKYSWML